MIPTPICYGVTSTTVLQHYDIATAEYQQVLSLTEDQEIIGFATNGLENINQYLQSSVDQIDTSGSHEQINSSEMPDPLAYSEPELEDLDPSEEFDSNNLDLTFLESIKKLWMGLRIIFK